MPSAPWRARMTSALAGGLGLALASALALDAGFLIQQGAVARTRELSLRRPLASAGSAASRAAAGSWGSALALSGWGLYFAALTLAPLSLVQTVAAGGIGLLVVLAAIGRRALPVRRERVGALLATARPDGARREHRAFGGESAARPRPAGCGRTRGGVPRRRGLGPAKAVGGARRPRRRPLLRRRRRHQQVAPDHAPPPPRPGRAGGLALSLRNGGCTRPRLRRPPAGLPARRSRSPRSAR